MPSDRDGAALLAAASAEDLERDAAVAMNEAGNCSRGESAYRDSLLRLAALARAVAKMQREGEVSAAGGLGGGERIAWWAFADGQVSLGRAPDDALAVTDWGFVGLESTAPRTLPAALASLLGGAR